VSPDPPEVGEALSVEFVLPGLKAPVGIRAEVVWRRELGTPDSPGMGIQFVDVEETLRQRISTFVGIGNGCPRAYSSRRFSSSASRARSARALSVSPR
jgi:hypothetical protein